jgi:DNA polymerase-1
MEYSMLIIFDSNQLCYSAFYSLSDLTNKEEATGIIFGFLKQVYSVTKLFYEKKPTLIFAWDSKLSYRRNFYKNYKRKRREKKYQKEYTGPSDIHYEQFDIIRKELLPQIGFNNVFIQPGFEADDIIANICNNYQGEQKIIVSSDEDLYQLLDINTSMYKIKAKRLYTDSDWFSEHGEGNVTTADWAKVKALAGCSTDEVAGIRGVGAKTAVKYLAGNLKETTKAYKAIEQKRNKLLYERNLPLVTIPYPWEKMDKLKVRKNKLDFDNFHSICTEYNFKSIIAEISQWRKILKLKLK